MRGRSARLLLGLPPFLIIGGTLLFFLRTRDPMAFAYGGLLACIYVVGFVAGARLRRRRPRS